MFAGERQKYILEQLRANGDVSVEKLAKKLDVSLMTIRRDLQKMSDEGQIERYHGGAIIKSEEPYVKKAVSHNEEKLAIAKKAVDMIKDGNCIFLDAGTTTFQMVPLLEQFHNLTIVTNDLEIAYKVARMKFDVIIIGGRLQKTTSCMFGMMTNDALQQLKFDQAFMGAATIDEQFDVLTPTEVKAAYKRTVVENSNYSYLLVDSGKFNRRAMVKVNNLRDYTGVITTYQFSEDEGVQILENDISIISVK